MGFQGLLLRPVLKDARSPVESTPRVADDVVAFCACAGLLSGKPLRRHPHLHHLHRFGYDGSMHSVDPSLPSAYSSAV